MFCLLPQDKANHIVYGALIAVLALIALLALRVLDAFARLAPSVCVLVSIALAVLVAWWKEWVYDAAHLDVHTVDVRDFWATVAGALLVNLHALLLVQFV